MLILFFCEDIKLQCSYCGNKFPPHKRSDYQRHTVDRSGSRSGAERSNSMGHFLGHTFWIPEQTDKKNHEWENVKRVPNIIAADRKQQI